MLPRSSWLFCVSSVAGGAQPQGSVFGKAKVKQIARMSTSITKPAVAREGKSPQCLPELLKWRGREDAQALSAELMLLPLGEGAHPTASLSVKSNS